MKKILIILFITTFVNISFAVNGGTITSIGLFVGYNGKTYIQVNHSISAQNLYSRAPGTAYVYAQDPTANAWQISFIEWNDNDPAKSAATWSTLQKATGDATLHLEIDGVSKIAPNQLYNRDNTEGFILLERWRISK